MRGFEINGEKFWAKTLGIQFVIDLDMAQIIKHPPAAIDITIDLAHTDAMVAFFSDLYRKCQADPKYVFTVISPEFIACRSRVSELYLSTGLNGIILEIRSLDPQIKTLKERRECAIERLLEPPI